MLHCNIRTLGTRFLFIGAAHQTISSSAPPGNGGVTNGGGSGPDGDSDTTPRAHGSTVDMAHDLILGHNRCFFAYFGRVHPTDEESA